MNTTLISKIFLLKPADGPEDGTEYAREDIITVVNNTTSGKVGYYWARVRDLDNPGQTLDVVVVLSIDGGNSPIMTSTYVVAKPCPPACGDEGGALVPTNSVDPDTIPTS